MRTVSTDGLCRAFRWTLLCSAALFAESAAADDASTYCLRATFDWTAESHAYDFPENPHFSRLVGAVHNSRYRLFADGETSSTGLALIATNGRPGVLEAEFAEARRRGRVGESFIGPALASGVGTLSVRFEATQQHFQFSFATMLAPSPDWITGLASVTLFEDGVWRDEAVGTLWVWDAGADAGETYEAKNAPNQPKESLRLAAGPQFLTDAGLAPVGLARISRIAEGGDCEE